MYDFKGTERREVEKKTKIDTPNFMTKATIETIEALKEIFYK